MCTNYMSEQGVYVVWVYDVLEGMWCHMYQIVYQCMYQLDFQDHSNN